MKNKEKRKLVEKICSISTLLDEVIHFIEKNDSDMETSVFFKAKMDILDKANKYVEEIKIGEL